MFKDEISAVMTAAKAKSEFLKKNPMGYFLASVLAGMFVGFGILLIFSIGGLLKGLPYARVAMGLSFGIALSLVIMAGSELFTGNNFIMTVGALGKKVRWKEVMKVWIVCFVGNWVGAVILAFIFKGTGLTEGATGEVIAATSAMKMGLDFVPLLLRGVLCNILVCLAIWCSFRIKSESGKLIMIFWCLFAFITTGFEHSIANMTLLTVSLLSPLEASISLGGYFYNIFVSSLGNMLGAIVCMAIPYVIIAREKEV